MPLAFSEAGHPTSVDPEAMRRFAGDLRAFATAEWGKRRRSCYRRAMPTVRFEGHAIPCEVGDRLRSVLLKAGLSPHNGKSQQLNCRAFGTCGTCAVAVTGEVSPPSPREKARLGFPPHRVDAGLRLACQTKVLGDLEVVKHEGFWGQHTDRPRRARGAEGGDDDARAGTGG